MIEYTRLQETILKENEAIDRKRSNLEILRIELRTWYYEVMDPPGILDIPSQLQNSQGRMKEGFTSIKDNLKYIKIKKINNKWQLK